MHVPIKNVDSLSITYTKTDRICIKRKEKKKKKIRVSFGVMQRKKKTNKINKQINFTKINIVVSLSSRIVSFFFFVF